MNSGNTGSPTLLESTSEDSEDVHPVDAVIQAAISRQQSPVSGAASKDRVGKRKREVLATSDVIPLRSSSESHSSASDEYKVDRHPALPPQSQAVPATGIAPVGVTVVEEGSQTRNAEVQRLLRGGRQVPIWTLQSLSLAKCQHLQPFRASDRPARSASLCNAL